MKKQFKRFLQTFITIEKIAFNENGSPKEFCVMYVFNKRVASGVFDAPEEKDELCEYLGII
ncbi:hypothetical protein EGH90_12495 [Kaistella haifensis]|nr:hypothetical protein EGH90_12495 [Kaistella haifensis]